jgi:hypothetical protein
LSAGQGHHFQIGLLQQAISRVDAGSRNMLSLLRPTHCLGFREINLQWAAKAAHVAIIIPEQ